jgi:hypothetical protein
MENRANHPGRKRVDRNALKPHLQGKRVKISSVYAERMAALCRQLEAMSLSEISHEPKRPLFLEKLRREIRALIYKFFDMPRWDIDIQ